MYHFRAPIILMFSWSPEGFQFTGIFILWKWELKNRDKGISGLLRFSVLRGSTVHCTSVALSVVSVVELVYCVAVAENNGTKCVSVSFINLSNNHIYHNILTYHPYIYQNKPRHSCLMEPGTRWTSRTPAQTHWTHHCCTTSHLLMWWGIP